MNRRQQEAFVKLIRIQNNPHPGDQIIASNGYRLRVIDRGINTVSWERITRSGDLVDRNTWTLQGWQRVVCRNARAAG